MNNLTVAGLETFEAREDFDRLTISGMAKCNGTKLRAQRMEVTGILDFSSYCNAWANCCEIMGVCKLTGYLTVQKAKVTGSLELGTLKAEQADIMGVVKAGTMAEAEKMSVMGVLKSACAKIKKLEASGALQIENVLEGDRADVSGTVRAGKVEMAWLSCSGYIRADGQILADRIEAKGILQAKEILGDHICIDNRHLRKEARRTLFGKKFMSGSDACSVSSAELIEATTIILYNVQAKQVNGQDIIIGSDCIVDQVDCSGTLKISRSAQVGEIQGTPEWID